MLPLLSLLKTNILGHCYHIVYIKMTNKHREWNYSISSATVFLFAWPFSGRRTAGRKYKPKLKSSWSTYKELILWDLLRCKAVSNAKINWRDEKLIFLFVEIRIVFNKLLFEKIRKFIYRNIIIHTYFKRTKAKAYEYKFNKLLSISLNLY